MNYNPYQQPYANPYMGSYGVPNYGRPQYNMPQQPVMQQAQQPTMQSVTPTICYAKMEEAKPFIITSANSSMLFIDREKNKALLKTTDNMCTSYARYFDISETDENGNPLQRQENTNPQVDFGQFARRDELNGFVTIEQYKQLSDQYNFLVEQFKSMQKQITGVKPNVANNAK